MTSCAQKSKYVVIGGSDGPEPSSQERRELMELAREIDPKSGEACEGIIECTDTELAQALYHTLIAKGYDTGGRAASILAWYEESGFMEELDDDDEG